MCAHQTLEALLDWPINTTEHEPLAALQCFRSRCWAGVPVRITSPSSAPNQCTHTPANISIDLSHLQGHTWCNAEGGDAHAAQLLHYEPRPERVEAQGLAQGQGGLQHAVDRRDLEIQLLQGSALSIDAKFLLHGLTIWLAYRAWNASQAELECAFIIGPEIAPG